VNYINLPNNQLAPVSPYCHAVRAGDLLFVTGQLAQNPETGEIERGTVEAQTRRVMENLKLVLQEADSSFDQVVMARVFVTDIRFLPISTPSMPPTSVRVEFRAARQLASRVWLAWETSKSI
jgi:enamine deaminase RidA (YjgF/YER057c/UK114 family)